MTAGAFALAGIVVGWLLKVLDDRRAAANRKAEWSRQMRAEAFAQVMAADRLATDAFALFDAHSKHQTAETLPRLESWMDAWRSFETAYGQAVLFTSQANTHEALNMLRESLRRSFGHTLDEAASDTPEVSVKTARFAFIVAAKLELGVEMPQVAGSDAA